MAFEICFLPLLFINLSVDSQKLNGSQKSRRKIILIRVASTIA
jgi:hypothetical protein